MSLRRPYGTPKELVESLFPTLKRGANNHCASGARVDIAYAALNKARADTIGLTPGVETPVSLRIESFRKL